MEVVWKKNIELEEYLGIGYGCRPLVWDGFLYYAFRSLDKENTNDRGFYGSKITIIKINLQTQKQVVYETSFKYEESRSILLVYLWDFSIINERVFLYIGFLLDLSGEELIVSEIGYKTKNRNILSDYLFDDKHLCYNQRSIIECFDKISNQKLWQIKIKGYLYTDIEKKGQFLFFGTAGKGGAFYCINIDNGSVITEFSNGDSSNYSWIGDMIVISDKKANLCLLNPLKNEIIEILVLKNEKFGFSIYVESNCIYTVVYNSKEKQKELICIKI